MCLLPVIHAKEGLCAAFAKISRELTAGALQKTVCQNENGIEIDLGGLMLVPESSSFRWGLRKWGKCVETEFAPACRSDLPEKVPKAGDE